MKGNSLNERQKEAVETLDGPLLVLAGAGAGKTKTIAERIRNLIKKGVAPHKILAITFTNKAAEGMRNRVAELLREDSELNRPVSIMERPFVSTFHSLGVHILRENFRILNISKHFTIFDKNDSKRAVKEALESEGFDPKQFDPGLISNIISREKGSFVTAEQYAETADSEHMRGIVSAVWNRYESILTKEKALDFDDLILRTALLLKNNEGVRKYYQGVWTHIHIDEYQDTNSVQYGIARLLVGEKENICVVGDVDQNIYSWRGANLRNILNFEKDYPKAKVVVLEENYRSTKTILSVANSIIEKNKHRKEKRMFTKNPSGENISIFRGFDEVDEADFVTTTISGLVGKGVHAEEIAILFRANFQSRALEEAFLAKGMPYQLLGVRFFERKEVKDVLSFIRGALNPDSHSDLKRITNVPPRGIGKVTLLAMLSGTEESLPRATLEKVRNFRKILIDIREMALKSKPSETIRFVIKISGIENMYQSKTDENEERRENIKELVTFAARYDIFEPEAGISKLLEEAALASDQDKLAEEGKGTRLMTVHAAKGLEFDYVFITGLEENLFPHKRDDDISEEDSEEERRLFYVAITRARKKVYCTYAETRTIFGSRQINIPSEFVSDIPKEFTEEETFGRRPGRRPLLTIDF